MILQVTAPPLSSNCLRCASLSESYSICARCSAQAQNEQGKRSAPIGTIQFQTHLSGSADLSLKKVPKDKDTRTLLGRETRKHRIRHDCSTVWIPV